jgi:hypothetical protein
MPTPQLSLPGQIASQAEFIVNNLVKTYYQHPDNIDPDRGVYDCDCNGFVSFVMLRSASDHYRMIPQEKDQSRPRAFEYYVFFSMQTPESTGGWHRIDFLRDAQRGDLIAWRFPTVMKGHDTGHVLIVAEAPTADASGIFTVRVYDSANQPHFNDTRGSGAGQSATGIGSGFINFKVDASGRPTAFQFSPSDGFEVLPIAIGRVEPLP